MEGLTKDVISDHLHLSFWDNRVSQALHLLVDLLECGVEVVVSDLCTDVYEAIFSPAVDRGVDAVGIAFILTDVFHEAGPEVATKYQIEESHRREVGVLALEEAAAHLNGHLHILVRADLQDFRAERLLIVDHWR